MTIRKSVNIDKISTFCDNFAISLDTSLYTVNFDTDFNKMINLAKKAKTDDGIIAIARDIYNHSPEMAKHWTFAAFASFFMQECCEFYITEKDTNEEV